MNWTIIVIVICIVAGILFTWQEVTRADRSRLAWRIIAVWVLVASLACIILPIYYTGSAYTPADHPAILLTTGFDKDSIPAGSRVFTTDRDIQKSHPKAIWWSSTAQASKADPAIAEIKVLGYGLDQYQLSQLGNVRVRYNAPPAPAGFTSASWPDQVRSGEPLELQGTYHNTQSKAVKLFLKSAGTGLDSVNVAPNQTLPFKLSTIPKGSGALVYHLLALSGSDTLSNDDVPFRIEPSRPLKVLMLNASPNFETRFLKDWLGKNGYAVASRALISKNKFSQEFVNVDKMDLQRLQGNVLQKFDVVIGDLSALKAFTPAEGSALRQQVTQKGLGVIIRADSSESAPSWLQTAFLVTSPSSKAELSVALSLQGKTARTSKLSITPSFITSRSNTQTLVTDAQKHTLSATTLAGAGKLVFTTLDHTYNWVLAGNERDHSALWSLLISKAVKNNNYTSRWNVNSPLTSVNDKAELTLRSSTPPTGIMINGVKVSPLQDPSLPFEWRTTYIPSNPGWQTVQWGNDQHSEWYVHPKDQWKSLKDQHRSKQTLLFASKSLKNTVVTKQIQQTTKMRVPEAWFYLIFLASCTFLWVERKFVA
ncbi:hypothetical protein LLH06_05480 [Mucilaginibacter daejeonensis]|uniref:hypothetical protein n=1 Tax=Mucilaginibacter daejeonensis TaxID=398049 RepID=UPI001D1784D0|nr:hypothetical protein [Mucilaginibacter daejeonensis]UEG54416.1 hypothetical protein LLH06_05480 [Mucilaginibacter daejeonensis]